MVLLMVFTILFSVFTVVNTNSFYSEQYRAIGADEEGRPVLFWAEGKGKLSYTPGKDSTGASLSEMAEIASALGLRNAVNLDGGGSAQILLDGERALHISDRKTEDNSDAERLVPLGLVVR